MVAGELQEIRLPDDPMRGGVSLQFRIEHHNPFRRSIGLDHILELGPILGSPGGELDIYLPVELFGSRIPGEKARHHRRIITAGIGFYRERIGSVSDA